MTSFLHFANTPAAVFLRLTVLFAFLWSIFRLVGVELFAIHQLHYALVKNKNKQTVVSGSFVKESACRNETNKTGRRNATQVPSALSKATQSKQRKARERTLQTKHVRVESTKTNPQHEEETVIQRLTSRKQSNRTDDEKF